MSRDPSGVDRRRPAPLGALLLAAAALVVALVVLRPGGGTGSRPAPASTPALTALADGAGGPGGGSGTARALPAGLDDRGWITETPNQRWLAGSLASRVLLLPQAEVALAATASQVASAQFGSNGSSTTVRVRDLADGRLRVSVDRPGMVTSAVFSGDTLYVAGDPARGAATDAGVQAISLADGAVKEVIAPGPAAADAGGPVSRFQLRLDPTGRFLGSGLCSADQCTIDIVDLVSGARTTPVRNARGSLLALTGRTVYLVNDTSTSLDALDATTGAAQWHLDDVQIGGVAPASDANRALISYIEGDGTTGVTFNLASVDASNGALRRLLQRAAGVDAPTFYPNLSGDRFAVIGSSGILADLLPGGRRRAALTLVDARTGDAQPDAVMLVAP